VVGGGAKPFLNCELTRIYMVVNKQKLKFFGRAVISHMIQLI